MLGRLTCAPLPVPQVDEIPEAVVTEGLPQGVEEQDVRPLPVHLLPPGPPERPPCPGRSTPPPSGSPFRMGQNTHWNVQYFPGRIADLHHLFPSSRRYTFFTRIRSPWPFLLVLRDRPPTRLPVRPLPLGIREGPQAGQGDQVGAHETVGPKVAEKPVKLLLGGEGRLDEEIQLPVDLQYRITRGQAFRKRTSTSLGLPA